MKCENIHSKFEDGDVRDFLSKNVGFGYEGEVDYIQSLIYKLEAELEVAKKSQAVMSLIKGKGWRLFDISDEVENYSKERYFSFIGTDKERDDLAL